MGIVRPVMRTMGSLTHTVRDMARLQQVATILVRHGLGVLVAGIDLPGIRAPRKFASTPARAAAAIQELGPTFIKFGQILSTRPDVIPQLYIEAFQSLQDEIAPLPFQQIAEQMRSELGDGWQSRFESFDESPLATASIAQVHRATLLNGNEVAVKIQRSGIGPKIRSDLNIMAFLATRAMREFPEFELFDPHGIIDEFEKSILTELDFGQEVRNLRRFMKNFSECPHVRLPTPIEALCTRRILCMEFLDGTKIRLARQQGCDMSRVANHYLDIAYTMLFDHGFFHGDLHPGNVLVMEDETIGVIDCGMVGSLTGDMKDNIAALLFALHRGDTRSITRLFFDIALKEGRVDYQGFERDSVAVVEEHWSGGSFAEVQIGAFLMDLTRRALRHKMRMPPAFTMFFKAVLTTEGLAKALIPEVDPIGAAQPYVNRLLAERWGSDRLRDDGTYGLMMLSVLARRLPITIAQFLDDIDQQRLRFDVSVVGAEQISKAHDRRQNRLILALFSITGAVCGSICLFWEPGWIGQFPVLSGVFYAAALPLFLMSLTMTLRNRG